MYFITKVFPGNAIAFAALFCVLIVVFLHQESRAEEAQIVKLFTNSEVSSVTATYRCAIEHKNMQSATIRSGQPHPLDLIPIELPKDINDWTLIRHETFTRGKEEITRVLDYAGKGRNGSEMNLVQYTPYIFTYPFTGKRRTDGEYGEAIAEEFVREWLPTPPHPDAASPETTTVTIPTSAGVSYTLVEKTWWDGYNEVNGEKCRVLAFDVVLRVPAVYLNVLNERKYKNKPGEGFKNFAVRTVTGRVSINESNGIVYSFKSDRIQTTEQVDYLSLKDNPQAKPIKITTHSKQKRSALLTSYKVQFK